MVSRQTWFVRWHRRRLVRIRHRAYGVSDRSYDSVQWLSRGIHRLGNSSRCGGAGGCAIPEDAATRLASGRLGSDQIKSSAQGAAIDARLQTRRDAAQRIVLFTVPDDDSGYRQRSHVNGAVEADWRDLWL